MGNPVEPGWARAHDGRMIAGAPLSSADGVEIACDESGYEGEKLIGTTTDVFAHASVRLGSGAAAECMAELRRRIRSPAMEYKANHVLREKHRWVLTWLLGPSGPLLGNAHVYLADKAFFVVDRLVGLLVAPAPAAATRALYREGRRAFGDAAWEAFLVAANDLMRTKDLPDPREAFFRALDALRSAPAGLDGILTRLAAGRPRADAFRARLRDDPTLVAVDPLVPAIVRAVGHWGEGGTPVAVVHDRQTTLSQRRIARLTGLASLTFADSRTDPRIQLADVLAGVARTIASDELNNRGERHLTALLRPYVDAGSIWGDDRSWARLGPARP
jgi:hypothetical protein